MPKAKLRPISVHILSWIPTFDHFLTSTNPIYDRLTFQNAWDKIKTNIGHDGFPFCYCNTATLLLDKIWTFPGLGVQNNIFKKSNFWLIIGQILVKSWTSQMGAGASPLGHCPHLSWTLDILWSFFGHNLVICWTKVQTMSNSWPIIVLVPIVDILVKNWKCNWVNSGLLVIFWTLDIP